SKLCSVFKGLNRWLISSTQLNYHNILSKSCQHLFSEATTQFVMVAVATTETILSIIEDVVNN
ncbi:hypothetical protein, partial [Lactiplantibacillus daowaiensis]